MTTEWFMGLWKEALAVWIAGGWGMIGLAVNGLFLFGLGIHIYLRLCGKGFQTTSEETCRHWIDHPADRRGPVGELLDFVSGAHSVRQTAVFFQELRATEITPFERDLRVMGIAVSTAPLLGLLGTVTGMLATFGALASGSGGEKTMGLVAKGISEALITTETGLVIALPGLFFQYQLSRRLDRYKAFLAHLETLCAQKVYKDRGPQEAKRSSRRPEPARPEVQRPAYEPAVSEHEKAA